MSDLRQILQDLKQGKGFSEKFPQVPIDDQVLEAESQIKAWIEENVINTKVEPFPHYPFCPVAEKHPYKDCDCGADMYMDGVNQLRQSQRQQLREEK